MCNGRGNRLCLHLKSFHETHGKTAGVVAVNRDNLLYSVTTMYDMNILGYNFTENDAANNPCNTG
mgnify:CR=1 FL=1